jgi:hypothetical protein
MGNPKSDIRILCRQGVKEVFFGNRVIASLERYFEQLPQIPGGILNEVCGLEIQVCSAICKERFMTKSEVIEANEPKSSIKNNNSTQN